MYIKPKKNTTHIHVSIFKPSHIYIILAAEFMFIRVLASPFLDKKCNNMKKKKICRYIRILYMRPCNLVWIIFSIFFSWLNTWKYTAPHFKDPEGEIRVLRDYGLNRRRTTKPMVLIKRCFFNAFSTFKSIQLYVQHEGKSLVAKPKWNGKEMAI